MTTNRPRAGRTAGFRTAGFRTAGLRTAGIALAAAVGLAGCTAAGTASHSDGDQAHELAGRLNESLARAGLPALDASTATALYGTDGGVSCVNVGGLQHEVSLAQFGTGSLHPRRVVLDSSVVAYDLAVIGTYCPDEIAAFQEVIGGLDTEETVPTP